MRALLLLALPQATWVVDVGGGPGVDFTDLPAAVAAAASGDVLLVRPGSYSPLLVSGKALTVLADPGAHAPRARIQDAGGLFFLEGLELTGQGGESTLAFVGSSTRGAVAQVNVHGGEELFFTSAGLLVDGARLVVQHATLSGPGGYSPFASSGGTGGSGILIQNRGSVHLVSSTLHGGNGSAGHSFAGDGGAGLELRSESRVWLAGSTVAGGIGPFSSSGDVGSGGAGLVVAANCSARVSGGPVALVRGGKGACPSAPGIAALGRALVHAVPVRTGQFEFGGCDSVPQLDGFESAAALPHLELDGSFVRTGMLTLALTNGAPGAPFELRVDDAVHSAGTALLPARPGGRRLVGDLHVAPRGTRLLATGVLSASGDFTVSFPAGALSSVPYAPFVLQAFVAQGNQVRLSNAVVRLVRP